MKYLSSEMIDVTCAIIRNEEDEVLIVQRGSKTDHPFKWEFPGGKVSAGETPEECIIREIEEELAMEIVIVAKLPHVEHDYGFREIRLIPFICDTLEELPFLAEHIAYRWVQPHELASVDFSEADIGVAKNYLEQAGSENRVPQSAAGIGEPALTDDEELQSMINRMLSMKEAEWVAVSAIENPAIFRKLLEYSFSDDGRLAFRASWTLTKVCDKYPEIIYPHLNDLVEKLAKLDNESALRSFLRIISLSDIEKISDMNQGMLLDQCFSLLRSGFSAIAVKAYSMEILYKLALIYPELANELSTSIRILMEDGSAGITSRGKMVLKKLADIPIIPGNGQHKK
jgi:8-oxo-dGTP diphosphatase